MPAGHLPHHEQNQPDEIRGTADSTVPQQGIADANVSKSLRRDDVLLATLAPLLEEVADLQGGQPPHHAANDVLRLLEENARLRKLAIKLSNLLGDLPASVASASRG